VTSRCSGFFKNDEFCISCNFLVNKGSQIIYIWNSWSDKVDANLERAAAGSKQNSLLARLSWIFLILVSRKSHKVVKKAKI
jgi:hypothetical protein